MRYNSHISCVIRVDHPCQHSDMVFEGQSRFGGNPSIVADRDPYCNVGKTLA